MDMSLGTLWTSMSGLAKGVVILMAIMSVYSIWVMIERFITFAGLKENLGVLATIGATAPFVGLFGTVVGIIHAFDKMATSGGGIASVSAGIAEALITTAFGLFVAIPAVWAYNYFQNRIDRFTVEMSNSGSEMAIYFLKETGAGH